MPLATTLSAYSDAQASGSTPVTFNRQSETINGTVYLRDGDSVGQFPTMIKVNHEYVKPNSSSGRDRHLIQLSLYRAGYDADGAPLQPVFLSKVNLTVDTGRVTPGASVINPWNTTDQIAMLLSVLLTKDTGTAMGSKLSDFAKNVLAGMQ